MVNLNSLVGLPGSRNTLIRNPFYGEMPHHFRYNPVCHISSTGRSLRLAEWSTGKFLRREFRGEQSIWELKESKLNRKDPRWVIRMQKLGLWPTGPAIPESSQEPDSDVSSSLEVRRSS
jgi:hypothetical protein